MRAIRILAFCGTVAVSTGLWARPQDRPAASIDADSQDELVVFVTYDPATGKMTLGPGEPSKEGPRRTKLVKARRNKSPWEGRCYDIGKGLKPGKPHPINIPLKGRTYTGTLELGGQLPDGLNAGIVIARRV